MREAYDASDDSSNSATGRPMCVNDYNYQDGKLRASIRWLITHIYNGDSNQLPDNLRQPFKQNAEGHIELTAPVIACLTNGSFYCQAATRIFRDYSILTNNFGSVFHVLAQDGIDVRDAEGTCITEEMLTNQKPFNVHAHLLMIDALMVAHLRAIVSIEKVVKAINRYTSIEKQEEPLDCVDALLFWINKVCLLVRDDVERNGIELSGGGTAATIPEMEDLYEDLCDGTSICTLIAFYQSEDISLQAICFKEPMHVNDCKYNLEILKKFCAECLPWNAFPFELDDILFLHESLQPNVNAFLADLFNLFEGRVTQEPESLPPINSAQLQQPIQRRFLPIQPISDLGAALPQKAGPSGIAQILANDQKRDRTLSMASQDSAMTETTLKSRESASMFSPRRQQHMHDPDMPVTHFGAAPIDSSSASILYSTINNNQNQQPSHFGSQQAHKSLTQIRLQMEEMRRQLGRRQQLESAKQQVDQQTAAEPDKDAFYRVMSRSANANAIQHPAASAPMNNEEMREEAEWQTQMQQLPHQLSSQMSLTPSHSNNEHRKSIGAAMGLGQAQSHQQQFMTSTPQQDHFPQHHMNNNNNQQLHHHYATPHHNLSPIGPPPSNSIFYPNDSSIQLLNATPEQHQQMTAMLIRQQQQQLVPFTSPPHPHSLPQQQQPYFHQQQHQQPMNYATLPNGAAAPSLHQQLQQVQQQQQYFSSTNAPTAFGLSAAPPTAYGQPTAFSYSSGANGMTQQPMLGTSNFSPAQNYNLANGGGISQFPLQSSLSQPSHLHLLHQQQQQPQAQFNHAAFQQQQSNNFSQQQPNNPVFQTPLTFGQHPHSHQQQSYTPIPPPFGGSSTITVFPSTETLTNIPQHQAHTDGEEQHQQRTIPFHLLQQTNAPTNHLDPQLELNNKDLTNNWGMTHTRMGNRPSQRKTWAMKQAESSNSSQSNSQNNQHLMMQQGSPAINSNNTSSTSDPLGSMQPLNVAAGDGGTFRSTPENNERMDQRYTMSQMAKSTIVDGFNNVGTSSSNIRGSGSALLVEDPIDANVELTPEMQAKRRALLASQIKRKERIVAKSEEKEMVSLERRQSEVLKYEQSEQRKQEREQRRQKLLEDYKRKKMEQELGEPSSARAACASSSSTLSLNRGQSQPPFRRPKSQTNLHFNQVRTLQRPGRTQSSMQQQQQHQENESNNGGNDEDENVTPRIHVPSIAEPSLKLFAKQQPKSNRSLIMNALQYSVFPGHVSSDNRTKAQLAIASSDSKHFAILFRDNKLQYRGLYTWDQFSDMVHKIEGLGPKLCKESMMTSMFKYDSGTKSFGHISTKHLSATIDGFAIADQYW